MGESLEDQVLQRRQILIGKAIIKMNYWQRLWWAFTGYHKYMTYKYWENNHDQ